MRKGLLLALALAAAVLLPSCDGVAPASPARNTLVIPFEAFGEEGMIFY